MTEIKIIIKSFIAFIDIRSFSWDRQFTHLSSAKKIFQIPKLDFIENNNL